jgi:hypothetical protein
VIWYLGMVLMSLLAVALGWWAGWMVGLMFWAISILIMMALRPD